MYWVKTDGEIRFLSFLFEVLTSSSLEIFLNSFFVLFSCSTLSLNLNEGQDFTTAVDELHKII